MSRSNERVPRRWSNQETARKNDSSTEESLSTEYSSPVKNTSTPLRPRLSDLEEINRSRRGQGKIVDTEEVSSDELQRYKKHKKRLSREKHQDEREGQKKGRRNRHGKRRYNRRSEESEKQRNNSSSESTDENYGESDMERTKRKQDVREANELPITEILRRSQENARTTYEQQSPLPILTTNKVYVPHRGGFSAIKINQTRSSRREKKLERDAEIDVVEQPSSPPIRVAIIIQQFWKNTGLMYQGLLAGMALFHFIMLQIFFDTSTEFVLKYSKFSEIYTNIFSFLIAMCIVSTFDKFDLARFDVEHLRELYFEYSKAIIVIPLYLVVFCLHQVCVGTDDQLSLLHYSSDNDSIWENITHVESLLDDLSSWQKITMSKDLLAVFAWLFISLGTKDDSFLMYLQSMEKYASDVESSRG